MTADPRALASLRSDGLLLPAGPRFAFRRGDEFSSDMVRDFALAVVFARDGFDVLRQAGAPRWSLRAARMACQGILINPGPGRTALPARMMDMQRQFDTLATDSGGRWADLPWEAALTAGTAEGVLRDCAQDFLQAGGAALDRILRLVSQRFSDAGAADPAIAAPVVAFLIEHAAEVKAVRYRFAEEASKLIASWLRAVRRAEMAGATIDRWRPLRARVREYLLRLGRTDHEIEAECLALLGADTDTQAANRLRDLASRQPHGLAICLERFDPTMSLAAADPELLFELTEAYYIEQRSVSASNWLNMGIRRHKYTHGGFGVPFADWRFGPFWRLLPTEPERALAMINRILDHAVDYRVNRQRRGGTIPPGRPGGEGCNATAAPAVQLDIPGIGRRCFTGDEHVWGWYRGTGTGPHPCMSALMAVERIADQWIQLGMRLSRLITMLLRDAHNLAMPGLVVGLLTRHAEQIAAEADPFLASADVWELESVRAVMEAGIHAQGRDDPSIQGSDRRSWTMADLAGCLVVNAINRGDEDRVEAFRAAGSVLAATVGQNPGRPDGSDDGPPTDSAAGTATSAGEDQHSLVVRRWASMLDASNYASRDYNGNLLWEWQPPADIEAALVAEQSRLECRSQINRLLNTYSLRPVPPYFAGPTPLPPAETLAADTQVARNLAQQPPGPGSQPHDAATAVAAALLRTAVEQAGPVTGDDLEWATVTIATTLIHLTDIPEAFGDTVYLTDAGQSAAGAAACLLMPTLTEPGDEPALLDDEDLPKLREIVAAVAASPFTGLRMLLARSLGQVWNAPCGPGPEGSDRCRHAIAWTAVEAAARDVSLGSLEFPAGRRDRQQLDGPLVSALGECPASDLMLDLLAPPLVSACDAARSGNCTALAARDLRDSLLGAYTRTAVLWGKEGYDHRDEDQYAVIEALLAADAQDPGMLVAFVAGLAEQARALSEALRAMTVAATYSASARAFLRRAWPAVMTAVLDAVDAGAQGFTDPQWGDYAIAELIPSPSPVSGDTDPDATISAARHGWPTPPELNDPIERLLPHAAGYWHAADSLIGLLKTMPLADQANVGLPWVRRIVTNRKAPGMGTWLAVDWLRSLSEANVVDNAVRPIYDALVDRLAVEDYRGAVQLQRQGEYGPLRTGTLTSGGMPQD